MRICYAAGSVALAGALQGLVASLGLAGGLPDRGRSRHEASRRKRAAWRSPRLAEAVLLPAMALLWPWSLEQAQAQDARLLAVLAAVEAERSIPAGLTGQEYYDQGFALEAAGRIPQATYCYYQALLRLAHGHPLRSEAEKRIWPLLDHLASKDALLARTSPGAPGSLPEPRKPPAPAAAPSGGQTARMIPVLAPSPAMAPASGPASSPAAVTARPAAPAEVPAAAPAQPLSFVGQAESVVGRPWPPWEKEP